jgi:hypothetical protein
MKKFAIAALFVVLLLPSALVAQTNITVDAADINLGYMNVYDLAWNWHFGQPWGFADLRAVWTDYYTLTLGPNTIGDPNEYWYQCVDGYTPPDCGGPGAPGNKYMEANAYAEVTGPLAGQTVTFSGDVTEYTLTSAHNVVAFVKDYAPDYSSYVEQSVPLTGTGLFSVTLACINDPSRHVQWGFQMIGVNVWETDVYPFGKITIGRDPAIANDPTSWGAIKSMF